MSLSSLLFPDLLSRKFQREFITFDGTISLAHASKNPADPSRIGASRAFLKVLFRAHCRNLFRECEGDQLVESHAFRFGSLVLYSPRTISPGRSTEQRKRAATGLKSRALKVTMASARPLIAVSRTISSFGSGSIGRVRIINSTLFPTEASSSSTADTSSLLAPLAVRCSGRVKTDSYSNIKEVLRDRTL